MNRSENIRRVSGRTSDWDIIVIGGGATGVGCAVDAATRGFDVLLLEQHDFGKGTSSRSTKIIHGGVRYLRQGNIRLVREALRERSILLRNAPELVSELEFVIPCYGYFEQLYFWIGMKIYDALAGQYSLKPSAMLSRAETIRKLPNINERGLVGGVAYSDAHFDDTRLLIEMTKLASSKSATMLNYAKVVDLEKSRDGKITAVIFRDQLSGRLLSAKAKVVVNASGIFVDTIRKIASPEKKPALKFSQGIHIVLNRSFHASSSAMIIPKTRDGRVLFCTPWHDFALVGTTDTPIDHPDLEPKALDEEIDFVLDTIGSVFKTKPTRSDIRSVFAGIRPLVDSDKSLSTAALSRDHKIFVDQSGLVTITGGKWTTFRKMAADTIDEAIAVGELNPSPSITKSLSINIARNDRDPTAQRLHPDLPCTVNDVMQAVRQEMAVTLEDVLARRTRSLFLNVTAAISIAPRVVKIMQEELGLGDDWSAAQLRDFLAVAKSYSANS